MGSDGLCDVIRYANPRYSKKVPLPVARGDYSGDDECESTENNCYVSDVQVPVPPSFTSDRTALLSAMKASLLRPTHRQHTACQTNKQAAVHVDANKIHSPAPAIVQTIINNAADTDGESPTVSVVEAYAPVEVENDAMQPRAANQRLVDEFLLDGSEHLNGSTLSGYPIYGSRTAEERLAAIRAALASRARPTIRHLPHNAVRSTVENIPDAVEGGAAAAGGRTAESREQYWRRLARHYIDFHELPSERAARLAANLNDGDATEEPLPSMASSLLPPSSFASEPEDPFYIIDLGRVVEQMALWRHCLPMVRPHFAVKCNPIPAILDVLAACGAGFDCASKTEIDLVMKGGPHKQPLVDSADDIVFANPCKQPGDLKAAAAAGVNYVTFDSVFELEKIARHMPSAKAIIRIRTNDSKAKCAFSVKFGAPMDTVETLLQRARALNVEIYGVSFHVGSGNGDASAYTSAVRDAHEVFQQAARNGFNCTVLDIGGGYPGVVPTPAERAAGKLSFEDIAAALRPVLEELFPSEDTTIIAEPGRFFTAATHALVMNVFSRRTLRLTKDEKIACAGELAAVAEEARMARRDERRYEREHRLRMRSPAAAARAANDADCSSAAADNDHDDDDDDDLDDDNKLPAPVVDLEEDPEEYQYYANDGLYGSFNCIIFDHAAPTLLLLDDGDGADAVTGSANATAWQESSDSDADDSNANDGGDDNGNNNGGRSERRLRAHNGSLAVTTESSGYFSDGTRDRLGRKPAKGTQRADAIARSRRRHQPVRPLRLTTIYGPTCDSMDCILKRKPFPEMQVGDWVLVPDMGSYTTAAGCAFNGFSTSRREWITSVVL